MVQCKAARFVLNDYHRYSSVTNMLNQLKWESLEQRRTKSIIIMFYKIIHNVVAVDFSKYIHRSVSRTRGHHLRYTIIPARINALYHSFLPTAIRLWNSLPEETVQSSNLRLSTNLLSCNR